MEIIVNGDVYINENGGNEQKDRKVATIRRSPALASAKKKVKARDSVCQCCGEIDVNGHLEIHHILPLSSYPNLATDEGNLVALCQKCHDKLHKEYPEANAVNYGEFMKRFAKRY